MINNKSAQGTIEYLVIIAVIIVIGLVVVSLTMNLYDTEQLTKNKDKLNQSTNTINVVDALNYSGETIINLKNTAEGNITLTKISVDNETQEYDKTIIQGNNELITLNNLCKCEENQTKKTCEIEIHYTTQHNLPKKITQKITINCEENVKPNKLPTPPKCNNEETKCEEYNYLICENEAWQNQGPTIDQCGVECLKDGDTNTINDKEYICENHEWTLTNCFNIENNPIQICSLQDLNNIRTKLDGNYILMKNIDASETRNWNLGNGFEPIGYCNTSFGCDLVGDVPFTGDFNGNNKIISNLTINSPFEGVGLFGYSSGNISNVGLIDININGSSRTGGIVGWQSSGTILNSYTTGNVTLIPGPPGGVGGLVGWQSSGTSSVLQPRGVISSSYSTANVYGDPQVGNTQVGGLVGRQDNGEIINSYATGNVYGDTYIGGLVGYMGESDNVGAYITNSYATGNVTCINNLAGGLVGYQRFYSSNLLTISNSFSTGIVTCPELGSGGLVGKQLNTAGFIFNSYFDNAGEKLDNMCGTPSGGTGCDDSKGIDTTTQPNYFYSSTNAPLSSWNFGEDKNWITTDTYPILTWQND